MDPETLLFATEGLTFHIFSFHQKHATSGNNDMIDFDGTFSRLQNDAFDKMMGGVSRKSLAERSNQHFSDITFEPGRIYERRQSVTYHYTLAYS